MGVVSIKHRGNFEKFEKFAKGYSTSKLAKILESYGQMGVDALSRATPKDTGLTASSWNYSVKLASRSLTISWSNSNLTDSGTPIVILLQYGFGTRGGGYVQGIDFINPAIAPVMDKISEAIWQEVRRL